ncbi:MAG: hypothetical protein AAFQ82_07500 [Myxococcota bacterium]
MRKHLKTIVLFVAPGLVALGLLLGGPATAVAAPDSWLTLGVGTSMNMEGDSQLTGSLKTRLRLLLAFGAELSYQPAEAGHSDSSTGVHGLLYLLPTSPVGGYLKAGWSNGQLGTIGRNDDRYDVGGGFELYMGEHVALGAEYLRSFPDVQSLGDSMQRGDGLWNQGEDIWSVTLWWFT